MRFMSLSKGSGILLIVCLMFGCASPKKVIYFQDIATSSEENIEQDYALRFQPDDRIGITVNSKDMELAFPFNLPVITTQLSSSADPTQMSGGYRLQGYVVDADGTIDFPMLGKLSVIGLSRMELKEMIENRLKEENYLTDPIITISYQNFKVAVMGEVLRPGTFQITTDRVTLLDVLSLSGDLTIYGKRDRVLVIRERDGVRNVFVNDLRSKTLFSSPAYYIQQNDIVYVEPNKAKIGQSEINQNNTVSTWISMLSFITSLAVMIIK